MLKTGGQLILLPESTRSGRKSRTFRYEISSFDRNFQNELVHAFRWRFPNAIREVTEISLVGGAIPQPVANISSANTQRQQYSYNKFTLVYSGTQYTVTIPVGFYTPTTLAAALKTALDAAAGGAWTVSDPAASVTGAMTITPPAANPFSLLFGTGSYVDQMDPTTGAILKMNSPALQLGFLPSTDYSSTGAAITSPNSVDPYVTTNRIYMYLNYDTTQDLIAYDRGLGRAQPSAIIYFDAVNNNRKYLNKETYSPLIVAKPAPISRIQTLDIVFTDFFGNPVNFGGREVNIALEITILEA
jgi:hypothetical protein